MGILKANSLDHILSFSRLFYSTGEFGDTKSINLSLCVLLGFSLSLYSCKWKRCLCSCSRICHFLVKSHNLALVTRICDSCLRGLCTRTCVLPSWYLMWKAPFTFCVMHLTAAVSNCGQHNEQYFCTFKNKKLSFVLWWKGSYYWTGKPEKGKIQLIDPWLASDMNLCRQSRHFSLSLIPYSRKFCKAVIFRNSFRKRRGPLSWWVGHSPSLTVKTKMVTIQAKVMKKWWSFLSFQCTAESWILTDDIRCFR